MGNVLKCLNHDPLFGSMIFVFQMKDLVICYFELSILCLVEAWHGKRKAFEPHDF